MNKKHGGCMRQVLPVEVLNELKHTLNLKLEDNADLSCENSSSTSSQTEKREQNIGESTHIVDVVDFPTDEPVDVDRSLVSPQSADSRSLNNDAETTSSCSNKNDETHSSYSVISTLKQPRKSPQESRSLSIEDINSKSNDYGLRHENGFPQDATFQIENGENNFDNCLIGIYVHGSDFLKFNALIRHPSIIIHVVDSERGTYLEKTEENRNVTYNQENSNHILPVMLKPFDFKEKKSLIPRWDELVIFNEPFSHLVKSSVIIFFEVVDFIDFSDGSSTMLGAMDSETGWHQIAWSFLKIVSANNNDTNIGKRLRLQFYKPNINSPSFLKKSVNVPKVFHCYSHKPWTVYPSTLYVTVKRIPVSAVDNKPQQRSQTPLQPEVGSEESRRSLSVLSLENQDNITDDINQPIEFDNIKWDRLPGQSCQIPNRKVASLNVGSHGCMCLRFSNSGHFLACGTLSDILLYSAITGALHSRLVGHHGLIYSLSWYKDDSMLLSSSADCTVCLWDTKSSCPLYILPHPSYVYCCAFVMNYCGIITGCFDTIIRVWIKLQGTNSWELLQELTDHNGYVNIVCTLSDTEFCSGDSLGVIIRWSYVSERWRNMKVIKLKEIQSVLISNLIRHPGGKRLLIHTRDSLLRIMDLYTCAVIQWFQGGLNHTLQCGSALTSCGSLLFSASEDSTINVWDVNTGSHVAFYGGQLSPGCGAIDYHPYDHIVAFSSYSTNYNSNTILLKYVKEAATNNNCGLRLLLKYSSISSDAALRQKPSVGDGRNNDNTVPNSTDYVQRIMKYSSIMDGNSQPIAAGRNVKENGRTNNSGNARKQSDSHSIERILKHMDSILLSYDSSSSSSSNIAGGK